MESERRDRLRDRRLFRAGEGRHEARRIGPDGITLTERGKGANTRYINNIAMENEDYCDGLLVTEVFTPAGHWFSYPSHRHDEVKSLIYSKPNCHAKMAPDRRRVVPGHALQAPKQG